MDSKLDKSRVESLVIINANHITIWFLCLLLEVRYEQGRKINSSLVQIVR